MRGVHPFLQRLADHGMYDPGRPVAVKPLNVPTAAPGDATRYAEAALEAECRAVASAVEGTRNHVLNKAAFSLGQLVSAGHLNADHAFNALAQAAQIAGLSSSEIQRTVPRALGDGAQHPRQVQLQQDTPQAFTIDAPKPDTGADGDTTTGELENPFDGKMKPGGAWILDIPDMPPVIWGTGQRVAWVEGESLIVTGPPGVGKTTVVQQLILARCGLASTFLGLDVTPTKSKVLYLAMDRPRQIARSLRRMVDEKDRELLDKRLVVWQGPLIADVVAAPGIFAAMAEHAGADTIVVDSVKDTSVGLTDSEGAGRYNRARQIALDAGVQMVEIAHQTKRGGGEGKSPKTLQDVHGGMELTAGAGSVMLIWGAAGDPVVEMRHLKQPMEALGPWQLVHDAPAGRTTIQESLDAYTVLKGAPFQSMTVQQVAEKITDAVKPSRADIERARRQLEKAVQDGHAVCMEMPASSGGKPEKRYQWSDNGARSTTWQGEM
ncbi:AAA family ATPase [Rhodococcus sp. HM1]|uniref:AAA family ATPase n=1 Tax=Rhodococcus sp. HM1 TaxID=2937759 RepID=UPI00200B1167|nr:AAA family ATPase [Rhodococcus sp. HM1]MCK8674117.1 AAA family ATPase [Rhodococcus sp. HM1]